MKNIEIIRRRNGRITEISTVVIRDRVPTQTGGSMQCTGTLGKARRSMDDVRSRHKLWGIDRNGGRKPARHTRETIRFAA